jgi:HSP20 family protein
VLKAELPGIAREDIDLRVENNTLTLRGERKRDTEVKQEQYHRVERAYGAFSRSFSLPSRIDTEKVRAEFKDGVLAITLPVKAEARPRQIEVAINSEFRIQNWKIEVRRDSAQPTGIEGTRHRHRRASCPLSCLG